MKPYIPIAVAAVLVGASALAGTATMALPEVSAPPVESATVRVCPASPGVTAQARLGASASAGVVEVAGLADEARAPASGPTWETPEEPSRLFVPAEAMAATQASAWAAEGPDRGLSSIGCLTPRADGWFTGVRSDDAHTADVVLVNLDATAAEVALTILGPDGPVAAPGSRGILVPPRAARTVSLGPLASSPEPLSLRVQATSGRVAPFVRVRTWDGPTPLGTDWVAPVADPAESVVVPGVPGGAGTRTLVVTNPGDRVARAEVELLGNAGPYRIAGAEGIDVPPGTTRTLSLGPGLSGRPGSIRLVGTRPLLAAVEVSTTDEAASSDPMVLPAIEAFGPHGLALLPGPDDLSTSLALVNPTDAEVTVGVLARSSDGQTLVEDSVVLSVGVAVELGPVTGGGVLWTLTPSASGVVARVVGSATVGDLTTAAQADVRGAADGASVTVTFDQGAGA